MGEVTNRGSYKPLDPLWVAGPLTVLRPVISTVGRETLLKQAQENLMRLQGEWSSHCVAEADRFNSRRFAFKAMRALGVGLAVTPMAATIASAKGDISRLNEGEAAASLFFFGLGSAMTASTHFMLKDAQGQQPLEPKSALRNTPVCERLKDQIADAEAALIELEAGQKKAPAAPFPYKLRIATPQDTIAKVGLMATIGAAIVYGAKTAVSGLAGFATCLTPRSILENLGSERPDTI